MIKKNEFLIINNKLNYSNMQQYKGFKCDFCTKILKNKKAMERHELYCRNNPTNFIRCLNCENMVKSVIINDVKTIFCNLHSKYFFTKKAVFSNKLANVKLEYAPSTCEDYIPKLEYFDLEKWNVLHKKEGIEKIFN